MIFFQLVVIALAFAIYQNLRRNKCIYTNELKENCLLTKTPILFFTGKRSPFYFKKYWNYLPSYLAEHGYDVYNVNLPWLNKEKRKIYIQKIISNSKFLIICDQYLEKEISAIFTDIKSQLIILPNDFKSKVSRADSFIFSIHKLITGQKQLNLATLGYSLNNNENSIWYFCLNRIQLYAETEYIEIHKSEIKDSQLSVN